MRMLHTDPPANGKTKSQRHTYNLKSSKGKQLSTYKEGPNRLTANFSPETKEARKQGDDISSDERKICLYQKHLMCAFQIK